MDWGTYERLYNEGELELSDLVEALRSHGAFAKNTRSMIICGSIGVLVGFLIGLLVSVVRPIEGTSLREREVRALEEGAKAAKARNWPIGLGDG
jgi:hypothetical protein